MLTIQEALRSNRQIKRKNWTAFYTIEELKLTKDDILSDDWQFEGQIWKHITEYSIPYSIDNLGNLYSHRYNKCKTPKITKWGYEEVTLRSIDGKPKSVLIHHIVAKYFLNHEDRRVLVINHIDGNKTNNSVHNLEIVSRSRNSKHAYELGLNVSRKGEKSNLSKLTEKQIIEIRKLHSNGMKQYEIAEMFNTLQANISQIVNRKTWKNV